MTVMAEQETSYALSDLVKRRRAELGYSLRTLADRCVDPVTGEQRYSRGTIDNLEKRAPVTPPQLPDLRALEAGLRLPLSQIQDAAGEQFLGIRTTSVDADGRVRLLAHRASSMSPEDLGRLLAIAETFPINSGEPDEGSK
jgi:transcriptional regulator with XRE-family HTH domain